MSSYKNSSLSRRVKHISRTSKSQPVEGKVNHDHLLCQHRKLCVRINKWEKQGGGGHGHRIKIWLLPFKYYKDYLYSTGVWTRPQFFRIFWRGILHRPWNPSLSCQTEVLDHCLFSRYCSHFSPTICKTGMTDLVLWRVFWVVALRTLGRSQRFKNSIVQEHQESVHGALVLTGAIHRTLLGSQRNASPSGPELLPSYFRLPKEKFPFLHFCQLCQKQSSAVPQYACYSRKNINLTMQ